MSHDLQIQRMEKTQHTHTHTTLNKHWIKKMIQKKKLQHFPVFVHSQFIFLFVNQWNYIRNNTTHPYIYICGRKYVMYLVFCICVHFSRVLMQRVCGVVGEIFVIFCCVFFLARFHVYFINHNSHNVETFSTAELVLCTLYMSESKHNERIFVVVWVNMWVCVYVCEVEFYQSNNNHNKHTNETNV